MLLFDTKPMILTFLIAAHFLRNVVVMRNQVQQIDGSDIGLALLVVATAWLVIFESGLFR